jgi:uncharacterized membrane protein
MVDPMSFRLLIAAVTVIATVAFAIVCIDAAGKGNTQIAGVGGFMGMCTIFGLVSIASFADKNRL